MGNLSIVEKAKGYDSIIERLKDFQFQYRFSPFSDVIAENFPELKESDGERIRKALIEGFKVMKDGSYGECTFSNYNIPVTDIIAWLEEQAMKKQVDEIKPKFKVGDWVICCDYEPEQIIGIRTNAYEMSNGDIRPFYMIDNNLNIRPWTIKDAKDGDVLAAHECYVIFKEIDGLNIKCYCTYYYMGFNPSFYIDTLQNKTAFYPATKEQRDSLMKAITDARYTFDFDKKELKKIEQKSDEWEPQTGDTFRKKGTTSPTYHLCNKREDGITFGFVENCEVGISGGEITIFALKNDYELVERPKSIEDVVEEELNRALQTKVEQKPAAWSEEDEEIHRKCICAMRASACGFPEEEKFVEQVDNWLKSLKDRVGCEVNCTTTWKPSGEQITWLYRAADEASKDSRMKQILNGLLSDLKKLKG